MTISAMNWMTLRMKCTKFANFFCVELHWICEKGCGIVVGKRGEKNEHNGKMAGVDILQAFAGR